MEGGTTTPRDYLRERLQQALGAAYALERELGGGGMSRVFVAEKARPGRRVVVKALATAARGLALADERSDARMSFIPVYLHYVAARTALLAGDRERSLAWLAESRRRKHQASPAWVRLDPSFAPLRGDPRFERLAAARVAR